MKALLFIFFTFVPLLLSAQQVLTLEECYDLAERNYPLARQTDLLEERSKSEVNIINKEKLPQLNLNAQATYQSDVIQFPIQMPGVTVEPPNNDQYRASLDVNQLIYHGGSIEANTNLKKAELQTQQQQVAVNLYSLRTIINQNYFSVLLFQEQAKQQISKKEQLQARLNEIDSGVKYGAVLPSTSQLLQAEILKLEQQLSETEHDRKSALNKLASLLSKNLDSDTFLAKPEILIITDNVSHRPELKLFEMQQNQLQSSKEVISKTAEWGTVENLMFVVGATKAEELSSIRKMIPDHFLLIPGVGFQGGSLAEVSKYGMTKDCGLLVNASRAIIYASSKEDFAKEARQIALQYQTEMKTYL